MKIYLYLVMSCYLIVAVILAIPSFALSDDTDQDPQPIEESKIADIASRLVTWRRGVWVGKDVEIVRTNRVQILFKREGDSSESLWSALSLLTYSASGVEDDIRGMVYANSTQKLFKAHVRDLWLQHKDKPYLFDPDLSQQAIRRVWKIVTDGDSEIVLQADRGEREIVRATGHIESFDRSGVLVSTLTRIEEFTGQEKGSAPKKLSESAIAQCLRSWMVGTKVSRGEDGIYQSIEINTHHHMYVFSIQGKEFTYCRAARYETCEKGMVFAQNIRLMINPREFTVSMPADNEVMAKKQLVIVESLLILVCVSMPRMGSTGR